MGLGSEADKGAGAELASVPGESEDPHGPLKVATYFLLVAALALGVIAIRAPEPHAAPPAPDVSGAVPWEIHGEIPPDRVVRTLQVEGMCCQGCAAKLRSALLALDGVSDAAVDSVLGRAQAVVPKDFELARLEGALTFEDYRVTRAQ